MDRWYESSHHLQGLAQFDTCFPDMGARDLCGDPVVRDLDVELVFMAVCVDTATRRIFKDGLGLGSSTQPRTLMTSAGGGRHKNANVGSSPSLSPCIQKAGKQDTGRFNAFPGKHL